MSLDCTTPVGRTWIERQNGIITRCASEWGLNAGITPDSTAADVDALFFRGGTLVALAEVKARDMTLPVLDRFGSYLITHHKIEKGRALARSLCAPFYVIVGLSDGTIVYWRIASAEGEWALRFRVERTATQATCNGGAANRVNAYLPLEGMGCLLPAVP